MPPNLPHLIFFQVRPSIVVHLSAPPPCLSQVSISSTTSIDRAHLLAAISIVLAVAILTILAMHFLKSPLVLGMISSLAGIAAASPRGMQIQFMIDLPSRLERYSYKELVGLTSCVGNKILRRIYGTLIVRWNRPRD